ncbi:hypothetical protein BP5796_07035 [Coleophoma crateriformis]|uniref:Amidase domain-containing protein n=1 Tax=Coleophoma crateriformis TaxID=565419 RepID=A0A3D8RHS3_9HELO|nr:hypothetical protein BP5796_07035 [Coleophoma crateriformis]
MGSQAEPWQVIAKEKRQQQAAKLPQEWLLGNTEFKTATPLEILRSSGILSSEELEWTELSNDATFLVKKLASSAITSSQLVLAFCKRAAIAHQLSNCLTEIFFDEALIRAKQLDEHLAKTGKVVGPLHGLPISVKDQFFIKGHDASIGITSLCFQPVTTDSQLVRIFESLGAIIIAKTTVPQTMLTADTDSIVFGRTSNAHNFQFGAAGSSGGEGALLALGGSAFGIGSDGAGSVRMPAAVNGVVGYKPSGYRLPLDGRAIFPPGLIGSNAVGPVSVSGFLARSIRDVRFAARLVSEAQPWTSNPFLYPSPWLQLDPASFKHLRIAVWHENNFLHLHPPVQRGFEMAQNRLEKAGYALVPFNGPDISQVWEQQKQWGEIYGLSLLRELISSEPLTEIVKATQMVTREKMPQCPTVEDVRAMNVAISSLIMKMTEAWMVNGESVDAILWVPAPHTAVPFDKYTYLGFTGLFNVIDWPALALPLGMSVNKAVDERVDVVPFNELDAHIQSLYDPDTFHGLPLSVQLIGRRFEDEKLLAVADKVSQIIRG